ILALISSAPEGTRMVTRALPGGAGSAARARASAACLAAWRAAQGAAPRRPSFRFEGGVDFGSSLMTGLPGLLSVASADDRLPLAGLPPLGLGTFFFILLFAAEALCLVVGFVAFGMALRSPLCVCCSNDRSPSAGTRGARRGATATHAPRTLAPSVVR